MQKLEGVVIPMKPTSTSIKLVAGSENYDEMPNLKPLVPFDDTVIAFF